MTNRDIAIVGMACVLPGARSLRQYWSNLVGGVDAIGDPPEGRWEDAHNFELPPEHEAHLSTSRGGFMPSGLLFDPLKYGVIPNAVRHGDPDQFLMLQLIGEALRDADVGQDDPVRERTDVIIGRGGYPTAKQMELTLRTELLHLCLELIERRFPDLLADGRRDEIDRYLRSTLAPNEADSVGTSIPNIVASRAANRLNLRGTAYTVDAACASSLIAVEHSVRRLRQTECDLAVAGGLFLHQVPSFSHVFTRLGAISPTGMIRPFDRRADGLLVGEGGGVVILKRAADAIRAGDQIYALIKGAGSASDGRDVDVMAPSTQGQIAALQRAYADAGLDPGTIEYLEAHGTGTVVGDATELATIKAFFGTSDEPPTRRAMGSVKSMLGHTMPASGIASLIKVALALSNKVLPASLHCEEPRPELADAPFYVITQTRPWIHDGADGPRRAGVNTFGFGGINAHVVLEEVREVKAKRRRLPRPRPIQPGLRRPSELVVLAADSIGELSERLGSLEEFLARDKSDYTLADVAWSLSRQSDLAKPCKLAVISRDIEDLQALIAGARDRLAGPQPSFEDVEEAYFSADAADYKGRIACVFPGMAWPGMSGNYPDHLMELCLHYPEIRAEFDIFEARDRHPEDTVPTSALFSPPESLPEDYRRQLRRRLSLPNTAEDLPRGLKPQERYLAAMAVTFANWISWKLLQKLDIPVHMLAGQSQGELTALSAAGISDFYESAPFFWEMLNIDPEFDEGERIAFAWIGAEEIEPRMAQYPDLYIAIHTAPGAVIYGGKSESVKRLADELRDEQVLVQVLPYPPIHTPHMSHMREKLLETVSDKNVSLQMPKIDVYSSITAEKYPTDEDGIRDTLMMNLDHPVKLWQTIRKLYDDGARIFVQAGGGHFASHAKTLLDENAEIVTAALDIDTRNPITQLGHLCATLLTSGVPLNMDVLYEHRPVRELDFDSPQSASQPSRTAVPLRIDWNPLKHPNVPKPESSLASSPAAAKSRAAESDGWLGSTEGSPPGDSPGAKSSGGRRSEDSAPTPATPPRMSLAGEVVHLVPEQEVVVDRKLDISEDLFLHDHLFVHAESQKPLAERLPVLPMTFSMEMMAETAARLAPGLGLIGFENIRAFRWVALRDSPSADLRVEAEVSSVDADTGVKRVEVTIHGKGKPRASATVLFAESYRQDVDLQLVDSSGDGPWPMTAEEAYSQRYLFHGPRFHVISRMCTLGNPGYSAELTVPPKDELFRSTSNPLLLTDPLVMDGLGQLVGLWCLANNWDVFPTSVDKVELYCPTPPVGSVVPVRCEVTEFDLDLKRIRTDIEVEDGQGYLWMRIVGWSDWLFRWPQGFSDWLRFPELNYISDELLLPGLPEDSVCTYISKAHMKTADIDRTTRTLFHRDEMPEYKAIADQQQQQQFVWSRMALKDAVRRWHAQSNGRLPVHPATLVVAHDDRGRPFLRSAGEKDGGFEVESAEPDNSPVPDHSVQPNISFAHSDGHAVAIASSAEVGIDIEPLRRDTRSILAEFALSDEIALLDQVAAEVQPDEAWETRLWCAKEAVGKMLGTGLEGRPKNFRAVDVDRSGQIVIEHRPDQPAVGARRRVAVMTVRVNETIVAYTVTEVAVARPM